MFSKQRLLMTCLLIISFLVLPVGGSIPVQAASGAWRLVPGPNLPNGCNNLNGVAVVNNTTAWAAGVFTAGNCTYGPNSAIIQRWNGTSWAFQTPEPHLQEGVLYNIDKVSSTEAWAVGTYLDDIVGAHAGSQHTTDGGTTWHYVDPAGNPSAPDAWMFSNFYAVTSLPSTRSVWAAGDFVDGGWVNRAMLQYWNPLYGHWISPAQPDVVNGVYLAMDAADANHIWAAGFITNSSRSQSAARLSASRPGAASLSTSYDPLLVQWNGTSWSRVTLPPFGANAELYGISALAANDVWAVGETNLRPLTLHWDGFTWTRFAPATYSELTIPQAVFTSASAASQPGTAWTVGMRSVGNVLYPLLMRWDGAQWLNFQDLDPLSAPLFGIDGMRGSCSQLLDLWAVGRNGSNAIIAKYTYPACSRPGP